MKARRLLIPILSASLLSGCGSRKKIPGDYAFATSVLSSSLIIRPDGTFHQAVFSSDDSWNLDGKWRMKGEAVEFDKLYFTTDVVALNEPDLSIPRLMHMPWFSASSKVLYIEDQRQVYRKTSK